MSPAQVMLADMLLTKIMTYTSSLNSVSKMTEEETQAKILEMNMERSDAVSVVQNRQGLDTDASQED